MRLSVTRFVRKSIEGRRAWRLVAVLLAIFLVLAVSLRYSALQDADLHFTREIQEHGSPPWTAAMRLITFTGNALVLVAVGVAGALLFGGVGRGRASEAIVISLLSLPANVALKLIWDRARPDEGLVSVAIRASGASFPSGHAMGSTAVYGVLAALAWLHLPKRPVRGIVTAALVLLPLAICASRVYLGAHWFSDVVAGAAISLALLIPLLRWYLGHLRDDERRATSGTGE